MKRTHSLLLTSMILMVSVLIHAQSKTHELKLTPQNIHWGYYDAKLPPVLRIASGDTVRVETMIARGLERARLAGAKEEDIPSALKVVEGNVKERGPGAHPMT